MVSAVTPWAECTVSEAVGCRASSLPAVVWPRRTTGAILVVPTADHHRGWATSRVLERGIPPGCGMADVDLIPQ
jgi:hypothetical protein